MEANLEQAVAIAGDPSQDASLRQQAMQFCEQFRNSPDGWQACLKLFLRTPTSSDQLRFFCLQILEDLIRRRYATLSQSDRTALRQTLWSWMMNEMGPTDPFFIRNKFIQVLVLLFAAQYPSEWPSFFDDLLSALSSSSSSPRSSLFLDSFLRISAAIHEEVASLLIQRDTKETARNTFIKDTMRENAIPRLVSVWGEILMKGYQSDADVANMCLTIFAHYVTWIDINLVVNENFISGLYQFLSMEPLRMAACECLTEIVGKGMKPSDKLSLIQALNVTSLLNSLESDQEEFAEQVAKLINVLGVELCKCWEAPETRDTSANLLQQVFPHLVKYLGNEYDDTSTLLFPYLQAYTDVIKQCMKSGGSAARSQYNEPLVALLRTIFLKMKYDEEEDHDFGPQAGELDALFHDMRKNMKKHVIAIAQIDEGLFTEIIASAVIATFDKFSNNRQSVTWSEAELALHLVHLFGECARMTYVTDSGALAPLGEMLTKMLTSNISMYPHISTAIIFFENLTRYAKFFTPFPQQITAAVEAFVDKRGMHNDAVFVRCRVYYLFRQFVHEVQGRLSPLVDTILTSIEDLLVVQLPEPKQPLAEGEEDRAVSTFESQLFIYEAVGNLISLDGTPEQKQVDLLTAVLTPLVRQIEGIMQNRLYENDTADNVIFTLQLDHLIRAIGNISKGFPDVDLKGKTEGHVPAWAVVFQQALAAIVAVLEQLHRSELIRNATRFAFQRMVGSLGHGILNQIGPLITAGLLSNSTRQELVDFVPFISHITHKFKPAIFPILNELVGPLLEQIFSSLNEQIEGTDDALSLLELRKAYLNFLAIIFNADMEGVLVSEANSSRLNAVVQSVLHYVKDTGDRTAQKLAFSVLSKMVVSWGAAEGNHLKGVDAKNHKKAAHSSTSIKVSNFAPKSPLPGFDQFIYENILPVLFEVPMSASFNQSDGQCYLVMSEISNLQKTLVNAQNGRYIDFLRNVYLPSIGCPPQTAQEFVGALQEKDTKALRVYLQEFFLRMKSQS
ncbi:armadillo-type protein [Phlyctochytrium arcticum]|nr:armadillo-type protein [Phlyctochytrium arcticum]